jgi:hypothetical protein
MELITGEVEAFHLGFVGQGLEVVALFDSDDEGRAQEAALRTKICCA